VCLVIWEISLKVVSWGLVLLLISHIQVTRPPCGWPIRESQHQYMWLTLNCSFSNINNGLMGNRSWSPYSTMSLRDLQHMGLCWLKVSTVKHLLCASYTSSRSHHHAASLQLMQCISNQHLIPRDSQFTLFFP